MNDTKRLTDRVGFVLCTAFLGALTGCTTYVDHPPSRGAYHPPRPEVYVPPPAVNAPPRTVEAQRQVEKPSLTEHEPLAPIPSRRREINEPNRATKLAYEEEQRQRKEQERAIANQKSNVVTNAAESKGEVERRQAIEESTDQKAAKQAQKPAGKQYKRVEEVKKGGQRLMEPRARQE